MELACERRDGLIMVLVTDTGEGIRPDQKEGVFEPFAQLGRDRTSRHEGTGPGWRSAATSPAGWAVALTVQGETGRGSISSLTLPAAPE